jgi:hypothetical protein
MADNKYRSVEHAARLVAESNGRISDTRGGAFRRPSTSNPSYWRDNHGVDVGAQRNDAHHKAAVTGDTESKRDKEQMINKRTREDEKRDRDMKRLLKSLKEELTPEQKKEVSTWQRDPEAHAKTDHFFGRDNDEKIEELQGGSNKSEPHKAVEAHLGQEISHDDYKAGHTTDKYGRKVKIGALLQKTKAHPDLINQFANDSTRQLKNQNRLSVQVTRSAHGVAGQTSGGQSWENESCKNFENGSNRRYLKDEVKHGTVVAYLRNHHGHELARATFHPHHDEGGNTIYLHNSYYGPRVKEFEDHIKGLAGRLSQPDAPKHSVYNIHRGVYNDTSVNATLHPAAAAEDIHKALNSKNSSVRMTAVEHPSVAPEHIHKALDDKDDFVRTNAAKHPNASAENIHKALNDNQRFVRMYAASNRNATPEHIHKALDDNDSSVRAFAAEHPNATPENIHKALDDKDVAVRTNAAKHPNVSVENLEKASKDEKSSIRTIAKKRLKLSKLKEEFDLKERNRKTYKHIPSVFLRLRKKHIKETEVMNKTKEELDEAIKGWKHAGRDLMKMRSQRADDAKSARLVSIKKDGTESRMHDATSYHDSEDTARKYHEKITKLNPTRKIRHNLYVNGKKVEMLGENNLDEAKRTKSTFVFDKTNPKLRDAYAGRSTEDLEKLHKRWSDQHRNNPKSEHPKSEDLTAVHHILTNERGKNLTLPEHPGLGLRQYNVGEDTQSPGTVKRKEIENVTRPTSNQSKLGKQGSIIENRVMENYGLSKDLVDITRQILERKTEVEVNPDLNTKTDDETSMKKESKHTTPKTPKEKKLVGRGVFAKEDLESELVEVRGAFTDLPSPGRQADVRNFGFHPSFSDEKNKEAIKAARNALGARGGNVVGVPDSHKHLMGEEVEFSDAELEHINAILGEDKLNELKQSTLGSYVKKASKNVAQRSTDRTR